MKIKSLKIKFESTYDFFERIDKSPKKRKKSIGKRWVNSQKIDHD